MKLLTAVFAVVLAASSFAGPGPQQIFTPVKDRKALSVLKPGSYVAHECPHCGAIHTQKVGKDESQAAGFTCPVCKMKFEYRDSGGGKAKSGRISCVDVATGKEMPAKVCATR